MYFLGIEAFLSIVRNQSLTRAAEELHLAQSTISHRLKQLEQEMGVTLIERGKGIKEICLTPTGEEFLQIAERWHALARETQILQSQGPKLALSLGTVESLNTFVFPSLYQLLSAHVPAIKLEIRTQHSLELYEQVDRKQIDVAFALRETTLPGVRVEKLFSAPMVVLRSNQTNCFAQGVLRPEELDPGDELYVSWGPDFQSWHDRLWDPLCLPRIRLDSAPLIFDLMRDAKAWAVVPMWVARTAMKQPRFSLHRLTEAPPDMICYKLTPRYAGKPSTLQSFAILEHYLKVVLKEQFSPA